MSLFDDQALARVVSRTLADSPVIPDEAVGAFLTVANQDSIKAVVAVRIPGGDWKIGAVVEHDWGTKRVDYGVSITGTF